MSQKTRTMIRQVVSISMIPLFAFAFVGIPAGNAETQYTAGTAETFSLTGSFSLVETPSSVLIGTVNATETVGTGTPMAGNGFFGIWPTATGTAPNGMFNVIAMHGGNNMFVHHFGSFNVTSGAISGTGTATPITGTFTGTSSPVSGMLPNGMHHAYTTGTFTITPSATTTGTTTATTTGIDRYRNGTIVATGMTTFFSEVTTTTTPSTGTTTATTTPTTGTSTPTTGTATTTATATPFLTNHYALDDGGLTFETDLSPAFEVPPVTATTTGTTTATTSVNVTGSAGVWFDNDSMNYWVMATSPTERISGAHLHCGLTNQNGPIVVPLYANGTGTTVAGALARGNIATSSLASTGADCASVIGYAIDDMSDLTRAIREGKIYANLHSLNYPSGVARGQLREVTNYLSEQQFNQRQAEERARGF